MNCVFSLFIYHVAFLASPPPESFTVTFEAENTLLVTTVLLIKLFTAVSKGHLMLANPDMNPLFLRSTFVTFFFFLNGRD